MKLTGESKLFIGVGIITLLIMAVGVFIFSQPAPTFTREELLPKDTYTRGNPTSKTFLVEFSDFQCPACKAFKPIADEVEQQYKDKIVFGYRNFPLQQHPYSRQAAAAAEAAGKQGKFWEMYDYLFTNQSSLSDETVKQGAEQLKLDMQKFEQDLNSQEVKDKIEKDIQAGTKFGVDATPTFFLDGKKLNLNGYEDLKTAVDQATKQ